MKKNSLIMLILLLFSLTSCLKDDGGDDDNGTKGTIPIPGFRVECVTSNCNDGSISNKYAYGFYLPEGTTCDSFDTDGETVQNYDYYNISGDGSACPSDGSSHCNFTNFGSGENIVWRDSGGATQDRITPGTYTVAIVHSSTDTDLQNQNFQLDSTKNKVVCCQENYNVKNEDDLPWITASNCSNL